MSHSSWWKGLVKLTANPSDFETSSIRVLWTSNVDWSLENALLRKTLSSSSCKSWSRRGQHYWKASCWSMSCRRGLRSCLPCTLSPRKGHCVGCRGSSPWLLGLISLLTYFFLREAYALFFFKQACFNLWQVFPLKPLLWNCNRGLNHADKTCPRAEQFRDQSVSIEQTRKCCVLILITLLQLNIYWLIKYAIRM